MNRATAPAGPLRTWLATIPVLIILVLVVLNGTGVMLHGQLLRAGESLFPGYSDLRNDPVEPTCDPDAIGPGAESGTEAREGEDFLDDLFSEESAPAPPEGGNDFLDDLFEDSEQGTARSGPSQAAIEAARARCIEAHAEYTERVERITRGVLVFRTIERSVAALVRWGDAHTRHMLVLLIVICGIVATGLRAHIALRSIDTVRDDRVSQIGQLVANLALFFSSFIKYRVDQGTGIEIQHASLPILWMLGFALMAAMNVRHLLKPTAEAPAGGGLGRPLLTIPLYAIMACVAALYFFAVERHPAGPAIYLQKLTENAKLYVQVGLYVWTGMLLKRTRIAPLCFDVVRPFKLPPELLAAIVVAGAAFPTAYSGASGIFVIAAGAVIYDEMRRAGAHRQLALATTAMSGSLGVVLSPCLLVVVVAALNYEVTTSELYHWGWRVYGLSAVIFLGACILTRRQRFSIAPMRTAFPASIRAVRPLIAYALIGAAILLFYALALGTRINEHTAPIILPIMLLILLFYDRRAERSRRRKSAAEKSRVKGSGGEETDRDGIRSENTAGKDTQGERADKETSPLGYRRSMVSSTDEATAHSGALLMLMGLSMSIGGVIERSDLMALVPQTFGSTWLAMAVLVLVLVFIGMIMDPYGAVILVSVTIAPVAYINGINPLHFWMVVLAAFELGYLTPPVALNQLLTRQVVRSEPEVDAADKAKDSFWRRHESLLLPLSVMFLRLLLVGLVPLFFY